MLRVRQIPFIMCLPGPKTTLPPTLSPSQNILHYKTLTESWLRQAAITDLADHDEKTDQICPAQKEVP